MNKVKGMATNTQGFMLVEWLVYFFLILLVLTIIFHFSATIQKQLVFWGRRSETFSDLCVAQDLFFRDVSSAPIELNQWDKLEADSIAWRYNKVIISWEFHDKTLVRVEKGRDRRVKNSRKKSVIARNIAAVQFTPHYKKIAIPGFEKVLQSISCRLTIVVAKKTYELERTVLLRNRVFV